MSTDTTVRTAIVDALREIGTTQFGLVTPSDGIHHHLLEWERTENYGGYLMQSVTVPSATKMVRAWGVMVQSINDIYASNNLPRRLYRITIEAYYECETNGLGINRLIDHCRAAQKAIIDLTNTLGNTVDTVLNYAGPDYSKLGQADESIGEIYKAQMVLEADCVNPVW